MEVLGSGERGSPDPRRNTSKAIFERFLSGNKAATRCQFVAALLPLFSVLSAEVATEWQQDSPSESSIFNDRAPYDDLAIIFRGFLWGSDTHMDRIDDSNAGGQFV